jgi:uncharacterized membrane protein
MTGKAPWLLLAASLILNVFFAGGVLYSKETAERLQTDPESRLAFVVHELGLSETEREDLVRLRGAIREQRSEMRSERQSGHQALMAEMRKTDFDRARVEEILAARSQRFTGFLSDVMGRVHGYLAGLTPEKRDGFLALMSEERRFLFRLMREARSDDRP